VPCAVVHVHGASRASFWRKAPFMACARLLDWPLVYHLHGGGFAEFYEHECGPLRRRLVRYLLSGADRILVVSPRWERWVRSTLGHPAVEVVANSVPLSRPEGIRAPARIAFVGRLTREKGVYDLLEAVALLREWQPPVRVELAGDGDADAIARRARELGISDRVLIRGWCTPEERTHLLARATLFALPSHVEGLPMSLLEAMGSGCPVVATRVGGIPDVIEDRMNGLLVGHADPVALAAAFVKVLGEPALAERLGRAARQTIARRHSPAAAVQQLGLIYADLGVAPVGRHSQEATA
jgi:glycosyltransferase involved in cell wall biosynthesis